VAKQGKKIFGPVRGFTPSSVPSAMQRENVDCF